MTIPRIDTGDVVLSLKIYRDGNLLENADGASELVEYVAHVEIFESLTSAGIEATVVFEDNGGVLGALTGSERFKIQIKGTVHDHTYFFRAYAIEARNRTNQQSDVFMVRMVSEEFVKNEVINVFGNTKIIFDNNTEGGNIVETLIRKPSFLGTNKKVFVEETLNRHDFIVPNWRPFDTIYWICNRAIRGGGAQAQSAYLFYENAFGFHFKSIDKIIEDINAQTTDKTDITNAKPRLYTYLYSPKNVDIGTDQFRINSIAFPGERNYLEGLRHGTWSGYAIGLDPVSVNSSKLGASPDTYVSAYRYSVEELWPKMVHLKGNKDKNPIDNMDTDVKTMTDYPKRVRYSIMPNQIFDPKYSSNWQANYDKLVELQAYQWMRIETIKNVKLSITIPGNLDLYVGSGVAVELPMTFKSGQTTKIDKKYSGLYIIVGLTHKIFNRKMTTELLLMKDAVQ